MVDVLPGRSRIGIPNGMRDESARQAGGFSADQATAGCGEVSDDVAGTRTAAGCGGSLERARGPMCRISQSLRGNDPGRDRAGCEQRSHLDRNAAGCRARAHPNPLGSGFRHGWPGGRKPTRERVRRNRGYGRAQCHPRPVNELADGAFREAHRHRDLATASPVDRGCQQGVALPDRQLGHFRERFARKHRLLDNLLQRRRRV